MLQTIKLLLTAMVCFMILDFIWLGLIAKKFYFHHVQEIARVHEGQLQVSLAPAFIVYVLLALGIVHFVLPLFKPDQNYFYYFFIGAFFGLIVYGVYDFTNHSILKTWPIILVAADTIWGAFATGVVSLVTLFVKNWISD